MPLSTSLLRPRLLLHSLRPPLCRHTATLPPTAPPPRPLIRRLLAPATTFFLFYGASQRAHPWITQSVAATTIHALGDVNAQFLSPASPTSTYDYMRTLRMASTGLLLAIPVNSWYTWVSLSFTSLPRLMAVAVRVALSQVLFAPVFIAAFFGVQGTLEGRAPEEVGARICERGPKAWCDGLVVWPAVTTVNFLLVPLEYRPLLGGLVNLGWNTWLSYLNSKGTAEVVVEEGMEREMVVAAVGMHGVGKQGSHA